MRALWLGLLLVVAGCGGDPAPQVDDIPPAEPPAYDAGRFAEVEDETFRAYLRLQDALAHDRFDAAHRAAGVLSETAPSGLKPLAAAAASAEDIAGLRIAFRPLSEAIIASQRPAGFAVAYCPMAFDYEGARWVQAEGHLMNPYFGDRMLRCGAFEDPETEELNR